MKTRGMLAAEFCVTGFHFHLVKRKLDHGTASLKSRNSQHVCQQVLQRICRRGRPVPKSQHQPELNNSDDGAPGASSETDQPTKTQPARRSQRATKTASARQTAMQTQQPGSSAGPSSLLDLSASEAAAGLPPIHRPRTRSEHRDSKQHVKASSADAEAAASGSARHPPARRRTRQNASEDGNAGPLQPDADDITVHGSLRQSASAAPKR